MKLIILASGSKANAAVLDTGSELVLIDAGLSESQIKARMKLGGMNIRDLSAVLITHEHADHSVAIPRLSAYNCWIYANALTAKAVQNRIGASHPIPWKIFRTGRGMGFCLPGGLHVNVFPVNHDAADPVGFVISGRDATLGFATDLGSPNEEMMENLKDASTLFIEANYSEAMLDTDTTRPWRVKERIAHVNGHLSNEQAAAIAGQLPDLQKVILGHLSSATNSPEAAEFAMCKADSRIMAAPWMLEVAWRPESERCNPPQVIEIL